MAFISALRHSRIPAIPSIAALRKSLENPEAAGWLVSRLLAGVLAPGAGNVNTI
jgi:hypothetical protein